MKTAAPAVLAARLDSITPCAESVLTLAEDSLGQGRRALADLRRMLAEQRHGETDRLRDQKLRAMAELAAGAGHEINTPLAVISGLAQHLLKGEANDERSRALEKIVAQTQRIHRLITDLMFFARPPEPNKTTIQVHKLLARVHQQLSEFALEQDVRLERPAACRFAVVADPVLFETALGALVRNGIEAAGSGGWVRLHVDLKIASVEFGVSDSGPGLTPSQREHCFDPFYSGRSAGRGTGLGLSRVWRIAQLHGGHVRLDSATRQPTRFTLVLPHAPRKTPRLNGHAVGSRNGHTNGKTRQRKK